MIKLCAEEKYCPYERGICEEYIPEPSEINHRGEGVTTGYCADCGHAEECHEELTEEQYKLLTADEEAMKPYLPE